MKPCAARKPRAIDQKPRAATKSLAPGDDKSRAGATRNLAPGRRETSRRDQETAFQPSGNGISGQADLLSLAAFGS